MLKDLDLDLNLDLFGSKTGGRLSTRYCKPKKYRHVSRNMVRYERAVELVKDVSVEILAGNTVHALLSGNFIFGDFFEAFAVENDILINDLTISTLAYGKENVDSFRNLIVGDYVESLNLIVSDYFYSHNRDNVLYTWEQLDVDNKFQLAVAGTHTKVSLMLIGDKKIVITGSANLRSSRSVEEITIQTNPELYDFHKTWHDDVLAQYATIKKSIRGGDLWVVIDEQQS